MLNWCPGASESAIVTLSVGSRPFVGLTRPFMQAYAERIGAAFHVVDNRDHEALQLPTSIASTVREKAQRFLKLPLLEHFLERYARVLFIDDDVLISPAAPDLFAAVPCDAVGATVERHKPAGWHAMHWTSACELYGMTGADCQPKRWRMWNSGVVLLSRKAHAPLLAAGWTRDAHRLSCRVLCDQLYLNALFQREGARVLDLGAAFNFVGSELRRALVVDASTKEPAAALERRRAAVGEACVLHLTRKVPKLYTADWVARRSLWRSSGILRCARNETRPSVRGDAQRRRALLGRLPKPLPAGKYDIGSVLCQGQPQPCRLQPWVAAFKHEPFGLRR